MAVHLKQICILMYCAGVNTLHQAGTYSELGRCKNRSRVGVRVDVTRPAGVSCTRVNNILEPLWHNYAQDVTVRSWYQWLNSLCTGSGCPYVGDRATICVVFLLQHFSASEPTQ